MCDRALVLNACKTCAKARLPCHDIALHIQIESIRRWRIWACEGWTAGLLYEDAEGKLKALLKAKAGEP